MACALCNKDFRSRIGKPGFSFHRFPTDKSLEEEWVQVIRRHRGDPNWTIKISSKVCSRHFKLEDLFVANGKVYLNKGAVPTTTTKTDSLLRSLEGKGQVGCAQKHSLTFPVTRTMQAPLKVQHSSEFVVKKPMRTYSKCKSGRQQAKLSYIKSENRHVEMPRMYSSIATGSQSFDLVYIKPKEVNRTPSTLDTYGTKGVIFTNSLPQEPPRKLVCKEKTVGPKKVKEERMEFIVKEEREENWEDVTTCPPMSPEDIKSEEDKEDVATCSPMSPEDIKSEEDKEDVATCSPMSPEGIKSEEDKEDVATWPRMSPEDFKPEQDKEDVATWPLMSPEDFKPEEDKEDVATWALMSPEGIKGEEDKEDVATCSPMSPEDFKPEEDKEDVATCSLMSPEDIKREEDKEDVATWPPLSPEDFKPEEDMKDVATWPLMSPEEFKPKEDKVDVATWPLMSPEGIKGEEDKVDVAKRPRMRQEDIKCEGDQEDVATCSLMSPEDLNREEDKKDVSKRPRMSQEDIKCEGDQEDVATCSLTSPEDLNREEDKKDVSKRPRMSQEAIKCEGDQEDVATCSLTSPEDLNREEDKKDVSKRPRMSQEAIKCEGDQEDVATCSLMSPEDLNREEDKKDVSKRPRMSQEGIKREEDKKYVTACSRMSSDGIKREVDKKYVAKGPRMRPEGNVFSLPEDAERLDSQGIVIGHNEIRAVQEDCMKRTTSIADKVIETEIRNSWGREVVKIVNHCVDGLVNDVVEKWVRWHGQGTKRNIFVYKCYVCCRGWWRLDSFREHLKWHERNMDLEMLRLRLEWVMRECNIVARYIPVSPKEQLGDVDVEGDCWRCLRSYGEHKEMFEKGKLCDGCSTKYFTCTALLKHEGVCLDYVNLSFFLCKLCSTVWSTKDRFRQHYVEMHSPRSDLPISDALPGLQRVDLKREVDKEDVAKGPRMRLGDIKCEGDQEDVATCSLMSPEDLNREEDKRDVAKRPRMSQEGIKREEDKKYVAACSRMSSDGIKREVGKKYVAKGPRMCPEGNVFSLREDAERLDSQGIVIGHNEIRAVQEDCMKRTTSIADKVIETEIRNSWGREVVKIVNHCVDGLVNDVVEKWVRWHGQGTVRNIFVYKCYVCCRGWWRLDPFREHLKWHERNMDLEMLTLRMESVMQECNIVARSIHVSLKEQLGDVDVEGDCWRCLRSYGEHKEMFEKGKLCDGCSTKYYTCTALLKHEGVCLDYVNLSFFLCKLCSTVWSTKDRFRQHYVEMHSVRSDLPISDALPGLRSCRLCEMLYWSFDYHECPKRDTGYFRKCIYCCRRFQNVAFRKLHYDYTKSNVRCRACPKVLKRECMELEHMLQHSKTYVQVYKCRCCTESVVFRNEEFLKKHLLTKHNSKYTALTQIKTAAIPLFVPKTLLSSPNERWGVNMKAMAVEGDGPTIDYNIDIKLTNVQINTNDLLLHNNVDFGTLKTGIGPSIDYEEDSAEQIDYIMKEEQIYPFKKEEQIDYTMKEEQIYPFKKEELIDDMKTEEEYSEYSESYDRDRFKMEMGYQEEKVSSKVFSKKLLHGELIIKEEDEGFNDDSGDRKFRVGG